MHRVTIIMGIYNCAHTLQEALDSLYAQTYQDFKIVLCDDGSTDGTLKIAEDNERLHNNVVVIRNEKNLGLNYTLNHCLKYVDTEYVARMDGDDISLPTRIDKQIKFLDEHLEYAVVSAPMIYFDENGEFRRGTGKGEIKKEDFAMGSPICHAPCMARTTVIKSVGGYSVGKRLIRVEDYHLWFKIFAAGYKLYMMDECLYMMRDDRYAKSRRKWRGRKNTFILMNKGFRLIGLPWWYHIYSLRPIITYFVPSFIYDYFHKK